MDTHYEIDIVLRRVDNVPPDEQEMTYEQRKHLDVYGAASYQQTFGARKAQVNTIEVARATLKADKVEHLTEKVTGILESYQDQPTGPKPKFLIGVFDDRHAYGLPTSMVATTESDFFEGENPNAEANPHTMGDDGSHEAPGLAPVGYMSGADREDDELANASDLPTTRKRPAKKVAAKKAAPARRGRPPRQA